MARQIRATKAAANIAAPHETAAANTGNENSPRASPSGQLVMKIDIAVTISRSANQSVTILVITTLIRTAPIPLISLPPVTIGNDSVVVSAPPTTISDNPTRTTFFAP